VLIICAIIIIHITIGVGYELDVIPTSLYSDVYSLQFFEGKVLASRMASLDVPSLFNPAHAHQYRCLYPLMVLNFAFLDFYMDRKDRCNWLV
jgi:hypothetical protein